MVQTNGRIGYKSNKHKNTDKKHYYSHSNSDPFITSDCFTTDADNWDLINGFDLFETERSASEDVNSTYSIEKWLLCGSWTMPFPSQRLDTLMTSDSRDFRSQDSNHVETNHLPPESDDETSKYSEDNLFYMESSSNSSYTESDCTINSEVYNNSFNKLKTTKLNYNSKEEVKVAEKSKNGPRTFSEPKIYIPRAIDEHDIESMRLLDKKLENALNKVNYIQRETRNLISSVSNSIPCLDELMYTSHSLKTNTGKFKSSCNRIKWTAQMHYYKCILFIAFGIGVAIWSI